MKFVKYLTDKQNDLNLSQNKFAELCSIDKVTLSHILNERRLPTLELIYNVCIKFNDEKLILDFIKDVLTKRKL